MKGVFKCIKFLTFSITLVLCSVLFSADTSALELTSEVEATGTTFPITDLYCKYYDGTSTTRSLNCINPNSSGSNITRLRPTQKIHVTEGNYYRTFLSIKTTGQYPEILYRIDTNNDNWSVVSWNLVTSDYIALYGDITGNTGNPSNLILGLTEGRYAKFFEVTLKAKHTGDYYFELGDGTNFFVYSPVTPAVNVYVGISPIEEFKSTGAAALDQKDDEDRSNLESQQESSSEDAGTSASEANQTGTTLLAAFTSFVNALTSATPSNCRINMDLGNLDMGQVDLCQLSPPAGFSALASVFMILFCVPLSIATARKVISLFRSFQ